MNKFAACLATIALPGLAFSQDNAEVIAVGTKVEKVVQLLGLPRTSADTPSLNRKLMKFADGTQIVFVNGAAVSATAGGLAEGTPAAGFIVKRESRSILLDPVLVGGVVFPLPEAGITLLESYRFVPPSHVFPEPIPFIPYPEWKHGRGLWHTGVGCVTCPK